MDWRRLLCRTVQSCFHIVKQESTDAEQERYFILDDTTLEKSGFRMEGISRVYDHVKQHCVLGYKLLLLAITDTKSTLPLDFSLHAEAGRRNNFGLTRKQLKERYTRQRDKDDCMKRRADELLKDKPKVAIEMLRRAVKNGFTARYLLMDKWFFGKDLMKEVRAIKDGAILLERAMADEETMHDLECILGYNQNLKERA